MHGHLTEEQLERFLLHQTPDEELEGLETHFLACESCVVRLENLEIQIAATKLALREVQREHAEKAAARVQSTWTQWLRGPKLSFAAGLAALAIAIVAVPQLVRHDAPVAEVSLSAFRGAETSSLPADHRLHVRLNARALAEGAVSAELVNSRGDELWSQTSAIRNDQVAVTMPPLHEQGNYFVRLYASTPASPKNELLREYAFTVK